MKDIKFRAWHLKDKKMYFRGYQKWFHVLLCDDDKGANDGRGRPVKRAGYRECILLESTGLYDKNRKEIFEGDILKMSAEGRAVTDVVGEIPDTFGSSHAHPLQALLKKHGFGARPDGVEMEVMGNEYENPEKI